MKLRFMTAGESHGPGLVAILEGMPAGLPVSIEQINHELGRRQKGYGAGPRMKIERDQVHIIGGIMEGATNGAPIALSISNRDHEKWQNVEIEPFTIPRPGHADLTGAVKYGFQDLRPSLERASARETTARVAVGAICKQLLGRFGIVVGGYVRSIGSVNADLAEIPIHERFTLAEKNDVRCPDKIAAEQMHEQIRDIMQARDTLGGVLEIVATGVPVGLGAFSQWDSRLEAKLGSAVLSVQAIKGVEIGDAFENTRLPGTEVHDAIMLDGDLLVRPTNRAGGIEGGISNGEPIVIRAAMKPIATTLTPQHSVDLAAGKEVLTHYERSDFCPVPRAVPILEAMVAYVLANELLIKLGGDSISEMEPRYKHLRGLDLGHLRMDARKHTFWHVEGEE